jgi:hypothetical protein
MANDKDLLPSVVPYWIDQHELSGYTNGQRDSLMRFCWRQAKVLPLGADSPQPGFRPTLRVPTDLISGQFNDPVRVVAFNTLEPWAQDVSKDVALEIQSRCDIDGHDVPETLRDFGQKSSGIDSAGSRHLRARLLRSPVGRYSPSPDLK